MEKTVHKFGLKWITMDVRGKRIIERLTKKMDLEAVYGWVKKVKMELPEYSDFMDFVAVTGMRLNEAIESWHMLRTIGNLNDYYDTEKEILLNYKIPEKFMRKGKKSFIVFVPRSMVEKIRNDYQPVIISRHQVRKRIVKRLGFEPKFSDLREAHASIMTKYLNQNEIDFIQFRVGTSVFMQNYFNPALISDLKQRVFEGIAEIQAKLS
ncbi:MAG: integrase [Candidatus Bathyarchaeia archaeon]